MDFKYQLYLLMISLAGWSIYLVVRPSEWKFWFKGANKVQSRVFRFVLSVIGGYLLLLMLSLIGGKIPLP